MKSFRLIKVCLNKMHTEVRICKYLSDKFRIEDFSNTQIFNFALQYANRKVQQNQFRLKLNGTHELLVFADDVNLLGNNIDTIEGTIETIIDAVKGVGLEVNTNKYIYILQHE
jgi:hypothetical protein